MSEHNKFTIGGFVFDNYYEYRAAQEDVQKIEYINNQLDIRDPEVALRLYNDIREGSITFNSPRGEEFVEHVADMVAKGSANLLDDRELIREAETQAKGQRTIGLVFVGLAAMIFVAFAGFEVKDIYETRQLAKLAEQRQQAVADMEFSQKNRDVAAYEETIVPESTTGDSTERIADNLDNNGDNFQTNSAEGVENNRKSSYPGLESPWNTSYKEEDLSILPEFEDLYAQNSDFIGWLEVVDTDINYPVMYTPSEPDYYLRRDFKKADDSNGTLYVDYRCDLINSTTNTIIYGHNMQSGKMFGGLKRFLDDAYYQKHKTIIFSTLYEKRVYEIVAVGLSKVGFNDDDQYKYYDFIDAVDEGELNDFINNISSLKVSAEDVDINTTDKLLTLSTCNSYTEDGRLFIVAKRVE